MLSSALEGMSKGSWDKLDYCGKREVKGQKSVEIMLP